ncbi:MAG TPA: CAP domain-containing protein [Longimicrobiaceae bacterium]|nr:CAP domain-containing protein [Longimicrobiaceae bacterium]
MIDALPNHRPRTRHLTLGAVAVMMLAGCMASAPAEHGAAATIGTGATGGNAPAPDEAAQRVHALVNEHRARRGCPALAWDAGAARAAQAHSADMRTRLYFSHTSPDGHSPFDRLDAAGLAWRAAAENIAQNPGSPDDVVRAWLNSAGHRANIENCQLTRHGVGVSGTYWTDLFYTPRA